MDEEQTAELLGDDAEWLQLVDEARAVVSISHYTMCLLMDDEEDHGMIARFDEDGFELDADEIKWKRTHGHKHLPRSKRRKFQHDEALRCIMRDYLGANALFVGANFKMMFRISRSRFQRLMEDIGALELPFYNEKPSATGEPVASYEARLMLALRTLAYGVPPHTFSDYFQMSQTQCRKACETLDTALHIVYHDEYLRKPTVEDLRRINQLHKVAHGRNGLLGHLDCMHTTWKNCPKAWNGSFENGKEGEPTIVLEGLCDYNLWYWHTAYGFAGTMNDINILNASPLLAAFLDGSLEELERASGVVPFDIGGEEFKKMWITCDGIYPSFARFVKGIAQPCGAQQEFYTEWQESTRKDIERSFGVLQQCFQFVAHPILLYELEAIGRRIRTCIILHNMNVSDRVMEGDVFATYNPAFQVEDDAVNAPESHGPEQLDAEFPAVGIANLPSDNARNVALQMAAKWNELTDRGEHYRLQAALVRTF